MPKKSKEVVEECADILRIMDRSGLTSKEVRQLHTGFAKIAADSRTVKGEEVKSVAWFGDQFISKAEFSKYFCKTMKKKAPKLTVVEAERLFVAVDQDGNGKVDYSEFCCYMALLMNDDAEKKLKFVFDTYDKDKSGLLERREVSLLLHNILTFDKKDDAGAKIEAIIAKLVDGSDQDGDKKISYEELKKVLEDDDTLSTLMGQNITGKEIVHAAVTQKKSRLCVVM